MAGEFGPNSGAGVGEPTSKEGEGALYQPETMAKGDSQWDESGPHDLASSEEDSYAGELEGEEPFEGEDLINHEDHVHHVTGPILARLQEGLANRGMELDPRLQAPLMDALAMAFEAGLQEDGSDIDPSFFLKDSVHVPRLEEE